MIPKNLKLEDITYHKELGIIVTSSFYDQAIDSDIKQYEEIKKLTTGKGEHYSTVCILEYDYIKNHYRLIPVDLRIQRELDANPKVIQQN